MVVWYRSMPYSFPVLCADMFPVLTVCGVHQSQCTCFPHIVGRPPSAVYGRFIVQHTSSGCASCGQIVFVYSLYTVPGTSLIPWSVRLSLWHRRHSTGTVSSARVFVGASFACLYKWQQEGGRPKRPWKKAVVMLGWKRVIQITLETGVISDWYSSWAGSDRLRYRRQAVDLTSWPLLIGMDNLLSVSPRDILSDL